MNKYSLRFDNPEMENLYFQDQFEELFNFYTWACCLGTISAICVFTMEFIVPFGFGFWKYTLIIIPLGFGFSHRLIKILPKYFNYVLAMMNISLGGLIFILLYFFSNSNILFLAGQTVAMIQYSLLLGSNIIINIFVLLINQIGLMILGSIIQNYFNSLQLMFILALVLVLKAIWSSEKMKRQFFLLKHQNFQLHKQLDNVFSLKIIRIKFDKKLNQLKLVDINKQAEKIIQDQKQFISFIRQYSIVQIRSLSQPFQVYAYSQKFLYRTQTLEQILFNMLVGDDKEKSSEIYSETSKIAYRIGIYKIIEKNSVHLILLLQEDSEYQKILKLNKDIRKKNRNQRLLITCLENAKKSLQILMYLTNEIIDQKEKLSQNLYISAKTINLVSLSQSILFKSIHGYYNVLILNNLHQQFQEIVQFNIEKLSNDLHKLRSVFFNIKQVRINFEGDNLQCESNYVLTLQLILNLLQDSFNRRNYKSISIKTQLQLQEKTKVINYKIFLLKSEEIEKVQGPINKILVNQFCQLKKVNQKILEIIGWNNQVMIIPSIHYDLIECNLIHSLKEFKDAIQN
ncbi:unnamed protein product (macronuclear) [Paramecium tetraurelia]|uniref:Transmembrane protein n=1 Tax=Paramecium tetraurelia TaxID=5888 RepID=A0CUM2_PARTE|nr:uncharacterized protein GSPATT00010689001 [Paramecium tetraurelia]CAK74489.1 unnamed protein product [Paramecium tetraurelia]|eukprot:XP_001441886.1 hypothetical protein (macronuclear) [Paramecium tetraurelia strain d4-2]